MKGKGLKLEELVEELWSCLDLPEPELMPEDYVKEGLELARPDGRVGRALKAGRGSL